MTRPRSSTPLAFLLLGLFLGAVTAAQPASPVDRLVSVLQHVVEETSAALQQAAAAVAPLLDAATAAAANAVSTSSALLSSGRLLDHLRSVTDGALTAAGGAMHAAAAHPQVQAAMSWLTATTSAALGHPAMAPVLRVTRPASRAVLRRWTASLRALRALPPAHSLAVAVAVLALSFALGRSRRRGVTTDVGDAAVLQRKLRSLGQVYAATLAAHAALRANVDGLRLAVLTSSSRGGGRPCEKTQQHVAAARKVLGALEGDIELLADSVRRAAKATQPSGEPSVGVSAQPAAGRRK
jgi:hypothetical protein